MRSGELKGGCRHTVNPLVLSILFSALLFVCGCNKDVGEADKKERNRPDVVAAREKEEDGQLEEAIRLYLEAIDADPKIARAHLDLAFLLHEKARNDEDYLQAVYHYRRYLELRPETDKHDLVTTRIQKAKQEFVAAFMGMPQDTRDASIRDADQSEELKKKEHIIAKLKADNTALRQKNERLLEKAKQNRPSTYVVKRGDTLSTIAASHYGDPDRSDSIYEANKKKIRNKNDLRPGQILVLP